jgi:hypothetical protein
MRSSNGPFTTLLMFVPLLLVPVLAVFGVPRFDPASASSTGGDFSFDLGLDETDDYAGPDSLGPVREEPRGRERFLATDDGPDGSAEDSWDDPFAPARKERPGADEGPHVGDDAFDDLDPEFADSSRQSRELEDEPIPPRRPPAGALDGWDVEPRPRGKPAAETDGQADDNIAAVDDSGFDDEELRPAAPATKPRPRELAAEPADPDGPLTWRSAVRRLNELGIRSFQLQPGTRENEFQFSCLYTPGDNPRITHRFEAEAGDPLQAVRKVIEQVEQWRRRSGEW